MNRVQSAAAVFSVGLLLIATPVAAQSQQDVDHLQSLLPWAEALDKRLDEKRQRDAQKQMDEIAQMEQSIKDREAREAAKKIRMQQRAAAIKQWNPKDNPPPPLRAGEYIVTTRNGCRLVIREDPAVLFELPSSGAQGQATTPTRISYKDYHARLLWSGDCELGVANGFGTLAEPQDLAQLLEYESAHVLGRDLRVLKMPSVMNGQDQFEININRPGKKPIARLYREDPYKPLWGEFINSEPSISLTYDGITASTTKDSCLGIQGLTKKKFSGCSYKNDFPVYGVAVWKTGADLIANTTYCPNPKTTQGCDALWYQLAGPQIEKIKAAWQEAENEVKQEVLAIDQLSTAWVAQAQKQKETQQRNAELTAEGVFKNTPNKLTDRQIELLRQKYQREKNANGLNALDTSIANREAAAQAAIAKAQAAKAPRSTASTTSAAAKGISCSEAVSQLQQTMESAGSERQFLDTASGNQVQEQILWITQWYNKAVNRLPQCASDPAYRKRFSDDLAAVQQNCPGRVQGSANCSSGVNSYLDEQQLESALQKLAASGVGSASNKTSFHTGKCTTYEQCVQTENSARFAEKLDALPADNVNLKTRGVIAASDFMIANYQQCLPDNRCQKIIDQYRKTRADTLRVCQQMSTDAGSCTVSPF